jgi:aminoglycoside 2'-N-acetyltransferase I
MVAHRSIVQVPTYSLVPGAHLSLEERREILTLCSLAFETNYAPIYATFSDPVHILARLDEKLVSHALWNTRWLRCGNSPIVRTAYVEAVATDPPYQRRGFATGVMLELQAHILEYELGCLSPAVDGLYERLGWEYWRGPVSVRTKNGLLSTPYEVMVLRLQRTPALDLDGPLSAEWRPGELW